MNIIKEIKLKARRLVIKAIKDKVLIKPTICSNCNRDMKHKYLIDAHHKDYSEPLKVTWLCRKCNKLNTNSSKKRTMNDIVNNYLTTLSKL